MRDFTVRVAGDPDKQSDGFEVIEVGTGVVDSWHRWCRDAESRSFDLNLARYMA